MLHGPARRPEHVTTCCLLLRAAPVRRRLASAIVAGDLEGARRDWEDGYRRLREAARDQREADRLHEQVDVVTAELRRRVGATFTLSELAEAYAGSEPWIRAAVAERAAAPGWPRSVAVAGDAAFHIYARAAIDYAP
jgi:hypothetical protein